MPRIEHWREMWKELGAISENTSLFHELIERYSESHRRYHTIQHLDECFAWMPEARPLGERPAEVELALWFHDAIYDVRRQDNERKSADWAKSAAGGSGLSDAGAQRVHQLVMATRHDASPEGADARVLVDIDLSILGAAAERFDEYERQIREEYAWVPGLLFRRKRRTILQGILARRRIFSTDLFFGKLEEPARSNLERSLRDLQ